MYFLLLALIKYFPPMYRWILSNVIFFYRRGNKSLLLAFTIEYSCRAKTSLHYWSGHSVSRGQMIACVWSLIWFSIYVKKMYKHLPRLQRWKEGLEETHDFLPSFPCWLLFWVAILSVHIEPCLELKHLYHLRRHTNWDLLSSYGILCIIPIFLQAFSYSFFIEVLFKNYCDPCNGW